MKLDKKLEHFSNSVINDATRQSESIITEYEQSLKKIYNENKQDFERKAELTLKVETDNLVREKNKTLSTQSLEIRRTINNKNNELKERLFEEVSSKLNAYMKTEDYTKLLVSQIKAAIVFARGEQMTVYINASDADKKEILEKETGIEITISSVDFCGGTRAVIHEKHILIDHSFTTKLAEEKDIFQF